MSLKKLGNRAKNIKNCAVANVERSAKELKMLLESAEKKIKEQEDIISSLQTQLVSGVTPKAGPKHFIFNGIAHLFVLS